MSASLCAHLPFLFQSPVSFTASQSRQMSEARSATLEQKGTSIFELIFIWKLMPNPSPIIYVIFGCSKSLDYKSILTIVKFCFSQRWRSRALTVRTNSPHLNTRCCETGKKSQDGMRKPKCTCKIISSQARDGAWWCRYVCLLGVRPRWETCYRWGREVGRHTSLSDTVSVCGGWYSEPFVINTVITKHHSNWHRKESGAKYLTHWM